jgi:hypothetical protein
MMFNNKRVQIYMSLLVFMVFASVGYSAGLEQSDSELLPSEEYGLAMEKLGLNKANLLTQPWLPAAADTWSDDTEQSWFLAQADKEPEGEEKPLSAECAAFRKDPDADIGDIIRAGCQPTTAQMSALMDNPLGNVALTTWVSRSFPKGLARTGTSSTALSGTFPACRSTRTRSMTQ